MPPKVKKVTSADILLLAASKLPPKFTAEDLLVAAWQIDKQRFGLEGFKEQYPHFNKVLCVIMGKDGLVAKGKLVQHGRGPNRTYSLAS